MPDLESLLEYNEIVRKMFANEEEGFQFYNKYGFEKGFSVRRSYCEWDNGHKEMTLRKFVCSREGFREEKHLRRAIKKRKARNITRVGCLAKLVIARDQNTGQWYVKDFIDEHNHMMVPADLTCLMRSQRRISDEQKADIVEMEISGIRKHQIMNVMEMQYGGYDKVGYTTRDLYNFCHRYKVETIAAGDAQTVIGHLTELQREDPDFFFKYMIDGEGHLKGIMDPSNHQQQVPKSLKEWEEMGTKLKADPEDFNLKIQLHRSNADIRRKQLRQTIDWYVTEQRKLLDNRMTTEHNDFAVRMEAALSHLLKKVFCDLRTSFAEKINQERSALNEALSKATEDTVFILKNERAKTDEVLDNERSMFNSLIESFIQQEDVRAQNEVRAYQEVQDSISIPRSALQILMDNECGPVHLVKELYPDLQMYYDGQEELGQFSIVEPATTIQFVDMLQDLIDYGYKGNAELYYLNPATGSEPSTGLLKIRGQEEVNLMVQAHAQERTKICHLYLVNGCRIDYFGDGLGMDASGS